MHACVCVCVWLRMCVCLGVNSVDVYFSFLVMQSCLLGAVDICDVLIVVSIPVQLTGDKRGVEGESVDR